jgi:hypothetical protein
MTMQPARLQRPTERLLFIAGPRLGWVFRDRRQLITPYAEPQPDPQAVTGQVTARRERAERAWRFSLRWVARPLLPLAVALYGLGEFARDVTHRAHSGQLAWVPIALAVAGVAWPAWCLARLVLARRADLAQAQETALQEWRQQAGEHEQAELARLGGVPEWASATSPALRTDVYGGTLDGWQSLLAVHGASILAGQPLLVADFSGQLASSELTALAQRHGVPTAVHLLPGALAASGILERRVDHDRGGRVLGSQDVLVAGAKDAAILLPPALAAVGAGEHEQRLPLVRIGLVDVQQPRQVGGQNAALAGLHAADPRTIAAQH